MRYEFVGVLTALSVCHSLAGQAACNNTGKVVAVVAGDHNFSTTPCGNFSIVVAGATIQGPAQCTRGGAHYAGTVYVCQGVLPGTNCNNRGFKVAHTTYSDGGCPDLAGLIPGATFSSWAKVPRSVRSALKCVPPKKKDSFDWSASTADCPTGAAKHPVVGQILQGGSGAYYTVAAGPVSPSNGTHNPFLTGYEESQSSSPAVVQGMLGALVVPQHPRFAGAILSGVVTIEHASLGSVADRTVSVDGAVLSNGRFDISTSYGIVHGDRAVSHGKRIAFDGNVLSSIASDSENGNVWPASGSGFATHFANEASEVDPLYQWVRDPFEIPWIGAVNYVETTDGTTAIVRSHMSAELGEGVDTEYEIDVSGPVAHPTAARVYDLAGSLREEVVFKDYRAVAPGKWRPFFVKRTTWLAPDSNQDRIVVTLNLSAAKLIDEAALAAVPKPCADSQIWFVWL